MAAQVVRVEGPTVAMAQPYVAVARGGPVKVPLTLAGSSALPVVANLTVSWRRLTPGKLCCSAASAVPRGRCAC